MTKGGKHGILKYEKLNTRLTRSKCVRATSLVSFVSFSWSHGGDSLGGVLMSLCVRCGNIKFHSWEAYKDHMCLYHDMRVEGKPENKSGRTKEQIVNDVEQDIRIIFHQAGLQNPFIGRGEITW